MDYTTLTAVIIVVLPFHIWLFWISASILHGTNNQVKSSVYNVLFSEIITKISNIKVFDHSFLEWDNIIPGFINAITSTENIPAAINHHGGMRADMRADMHDMHSDTHVMPQKNIALEVSGRVGSKIRPIRPRAGLVL